jgi:hypothetical protein
MSSTTPIVARPPTAQDLCNCAPIPQSQQVYFSSFKQATNCLREGFPYAFFDIPNQNLLTKFNTLSDVELLESPFIVSTYDAEDDAPDTKLKQRISKLFLGSNYFPGTQEKLPKLEEDLSPFIEKTLEDIEKQDKEVEVFQISLLKPSPEVSFRWHVDTNPNDQPLFENRAPNSRRVLIPLRGVPTHMMRVHSNTLPDPQKKLFDWSISQSTEQKQIEKLIEENKLLIDAPQSNKAVVFWVSGNKAIHRTPPLLRDSSTTRFLLVFDLRKRPPSAPASTIQKIVGAILVGVSAYALYRNRETLAEYLRRKNLSPSCCHSIAQVKSFLCNLR